MSAITNVVVLGSGRIGRLVIDMLADSGDYHVTAVDHVEAVAKQAIAGTDGHALPNTRAEQANFTDGSALSRLFTGADYVISCAPYHCNVRIAEVAKEKGVHYLDLTEDVGTTSLIKGLAADADVAFIPQCGLAPGFITIAASSVAREFDCLESVKMRVGALPLYPHNRLKYNLTWSTEGLINEYGNPCEAIVDGVKTILPPLQGYETFVIDGVDYEAFNTSGGVGTLAETLAGNVRDLNYKTIRYPGHRDIIALLLFDFHLNDDRATLKRVLERALPHTNQDVVVVFVTVTGDIDGVYSQRSYARKIYHDQLHGRPWGAIQLTTAAGICTVMDLHRDGKVPAIGFVRQEDVNYDDFIANRFGRLYDKDLSRPTEEG